MAVEDKYVNTEVAAGTKAEAFRSQGADTLTLLETFEVAAADDDGSIYRVFKNVPADLVPKRITIMHDAITSGTDWDLGLYKTSNDSADGAVIDADVFMDGADLSSAARNTDGLQTVAIENLVKRIYEHAGDTLDTRELGYDIALTANTVGSAAGTITVLAEFVQG